MLQLKKEGVPLKYDWMLGIDCVLKYLPRCP